MVRTTFALLAMKAFFIVFVLNLFAGIGASQTSFSEQLTNVSNVRLTVNNVGTFGNAFRGSFDVLGYPSAEFPAGSGIEHLFEAGLWVGAEIEGAGVAVSTAAYDQSSGYSAGKAGYEFTAEIGGTLQERSSLIDNPNFSAQAVSHQDFVAHFSDKNVLVPGTQIQIADHQQPMNIDVDLETYNWNYAFSDFMVICNYRLTNNGTRNLNNLHIGLWGNKVVRNTNITPAGQGGSAFYDKGGNGFIDSLNLAYRFDATGDVGFTESYIGHAFLGATSKNGFHHPRTDTAFKANYQCWQFNSASQPFYFFPSTEAQRFDKMTNGFNHLPCWDQSGTNAQGCELFHSISIAEEINQSGNRSDLVSVGPFPTLAPGEHIDFAWAWVFAKKNEDGKPNAENNIVQRANLLKNTRWAQTAYNGEDANFNGQLDEGEDNDGDGQITRFILPTPPDIPQTHVVARSGGLDVYWATNAEASIDPISQRRDFEGYRIYATALGFDTDGDINLSSDLRPVAQFDSAGNGLFFDTGLETTLLTEPITIGEITYHRKYSMDGLVNGWQYALSITAFDRGDAENNLESLESSLLANAFRVFPGRNAVEPFTKPTLAERLPFTAARDSLNARAPFAYPNPYYAGAAWEGGSAFEEDRKLYFANLPERCTIRVFTAAGDLVKTIEHDGSYNGGDARWFTTYSDTAASVFSGGQHAWDLLTDNAQITARGTYLFSVEDAATGVIWKEKFVIIK